MMEVWDNGNIPGRVGQRTHLENVEVINGVGDGHFYGFSQEEGG